MQDIILCTVLQNPPPLRDDRPRLPSVLSIIPGVLAGILAIVFRSIGFIGKLMGEAIEDAVNNRCMV